jgi:DNA-binding NtrC family response regulator
VKNHTLDVYGQSPTRNADSRAVQIMVVSSDAAFRSTISTRLAPLNWHVHEAASGAVALEMLSFQAEIKMLLLDPVLPDLLPEELRELVRQVFPQLEVLTMDTAACQVLADSTLLTPFSTQLTAVLHRDAGRPALKLAPRPGEHLRFPSNGPKLRGVVGDCPAMQRVYALTHMVAQRDTTVLVTGESGTGKDLIAQAIHQISPRRNAPFVVVNCAAIPEALLESELFGYAKGAFTGALQSRIGRIHAAQGGTLFLDEIGDMPLSLQGKILRFVEQGEVQRLGSNENMRVDVRLVAATNADLKTQVKEKLFREDLYYRLAIFPVQLAPLRERGEDIVSLAYYFASKFCPGVPLTRGAIELLQQHKWPGNVRELRNVIERASIMAGAAPEISENDVIL